MGKVSITADGLLRRPIPTARLHQHLRRLSSAYRLAIHELRRLNLDLVQRDAPLHPRTRTRLQEWAKHLSNGWLRSLAEGAVTFHTLAHGGPPDPEILRALRYRAAKIEFERALRRGEDPERAARRYRAAARSGFRLVQTGSAQR